MSASIRIGTQGWSYPDWNGVFYPPGSKQQHALPFYAKVFDTVELDTTFYNRPSASVVRSWARETPADFRFTAKVPQQITHAARLASMRDQIEEFARTLEPLGEKLGPLLVQLPPDFVRDPGTTGVLDRFLDSVPSQVRIAVEFRDRSWHRPEIFELLRTRRACFAWTQWRDLPEAIEVTTDWIYVRWLGDRHAVDKYDRTQIDRGAEFDRWEGELRRVMPEVREVYGFFNNRWAGHSPASANEMKRRLGLAVVEPKELWVQRELW